MTTQQFKDGVLWADCLCLLQSDEVVLVTDDRAFYEEQKLASGLAKSLREEAAACPHPIRALPTLSDLLETIRAPIPLDVDRLQRAFLERYRDSVYGTLERTGFELGERTEARITPFATENPSVLFVEFGISFGCSDLTDQGRTGGALSLTGDCSFDTNTQEYLEIRNFGERFRFLDTDGTVSERRNQVIFAGSAVMGHRVVTEITRYRLGME